jgi:hypothetical protein
MNSGTLEDVRIKMIQCFKQHGLPEVIRVDNGTPFGSVSRGALGLSKLSVWWIKLGISVEYIDVGCPGQNATHERMHGSYKREVIAVPAVNRRQQQIRNRKWVQYFNEERPHESLRNTVPNEHYERSIRFYEGEQSYDYPTDWTIRRVHQKGEISWRGIRRFVGEAFWNESVALEPTESGVVWRVWFRQHHIGEIHQSDLGGMRPKLLERPKRRKLSK